MHILIGIGVVIFTIYLMVVLPQIRYIVLALMAAAGILVYMAVQNQNKQNDQYETTQHQLADQQRQLAAQRVISQLIWLSRMYY